MVLLQPESKINFSVLVLLTFTSTIRILLNTLNGKLTLLLEVVKEYTFGAAWVNRQHIQKRTAGINLVKRLTQ